MGEEGKRERAVRGRCSGEKAGRRHGGDGGRDARWSAVTGSRRCGEFFLFLFLENYGDGR